MIATASPIAHAPIPRIDAHWTVREVLRRAPRTGPVFTSFGLDAGRAGAARTLAEVARAGGVDLASLVAALEWSAAYADTDPDDFLD